MLPPLPQPLKICLGTLLAALLIGLQNIDEYARKLEALHPNLLGLAEDLPEICRLSGLPQWLDWQKQLYIGLGGGFWAGEVAPAPEIPEAAAQVQTLPEPQQVVPPPLHAKAEPAPVAKKKRPVVKKKKTARKKKLVRGRKAIVKKKRVTPKKKPAAVKKKRKRQRLTKYEPGADAASRLKLRRTQSLTLKKRNIPRQDVWPEPLAELNVNQQTIAAENMEKPVHYRIMLMGDSLMEDLGPAIYRSFRSRKGLHFILTAKFSTGLCRPEYFNWPENMENTVRAHRPDVIIVFMGANDGLPIRKGEENISPRAGDKWREAYRDKMMEVFDIARKYQCRMLWVGLPPMGGKYADLLKNTADTQRSVCVAQQVPYLDSATVLADANGAYRTFMTDVNGRMVRLRKKDMEHIAPAGNELVTGLIRPHLEHCIYDFRLKHPGKCLSAEEMNQKGNAHMEITIKYVQPKRNRR